MEIAPYLTGSDRVARPANSRPARPARGWSSRPCRDGTRVAVINVMGSLFIDMPVSMWELVDGLVEEARRKTPVVCGRRARRGDEREGRARAVARRQGDRGGRHAHARADERRARPARRHRGAERRRDDRAARQRHRRAERARDPADAHGPAGALRDRRRRRPPRRRAGRVRRQGRASSCTTVRVPV